LFFTEAVHFLPSTENYITFCFLIQKLLYVAPIHENGVNAGNVITAEQKTFSMVSTLVVMRSKNFGSFYKEKQSFILLAECIIIINAIIDYAARCYIFYASASSLPKVLNSDVSAAHLSTT